MEQNVKPKGRLKALFFLLLLAPALGELLSGSAPPNEYFTPITFVILTILYGGGALLIREARVRWNLGWSIVFLAIAYGIIEEGLMVQSFYNHQHPDLDNLSRYGMFLQTQWPWAIQLTIYHATVSTLIPILATDLLFPHLKNTPLLKKRGTITWIILLLLEIIVFAAFVIIEYGIVEDPYIPDVFNLFIWALITFGLIYLAYRYRSKRHLENNVKIKSPFKFGLYSFFFMWVTLMTPYVLSGFKIPAIYTVLVLIILVYLVLRFAFRQIYNKDITTKHHLALISGIILMFVSFTPISQFVNDVSGMIGTGIVFTILLFIFYRMVLRKESTGT